jgi:hypothetical protein
MHNPDVLSQAGQRATAGMSQILLKQAKQASPGMMLCGVCPVGRLCHCEVVHASDVLDDAVAGVVPDVHAKGEVRLGFHGQVPLDLSWPRCYFLPLRWCSTS